MFLSSFKRGFCLLLTVIVSCFFMLVFFCNLSQNSLKASAVTTYTTARVDACEDEEETRSYFQRFIDIVETAVSNPEEFFESTFYCTANCIGAIFSDESTMHEVYEKWQAIYNNEEFTIDQMQEIFYYGSDGNLYFTDEYLEQFYDLVDAQTFTLGVVSVPCNYSDEAYSVPLSFGISYVTSFISSILNGSDVYLCKCYTAGYFNDGFCISPYLPVASFSSYSDYNYFLRSFWYCIY